MEVGTPANRQANKPRADWRRKNTAIMQKYLYIALLISVSLACVLQPAPAVISAAGLVEATSELQFATVSGAVNLRDNPDGIGASSVVTVLSAGDNVQVIQRGAKWCKVVTLADAPKAGWALCSYIAV